MPMSRISPRRDLAPARRCALPASLIIGADSTMRSNQRLPWRATRIITVPPIECPIAKIGGGQSGSTTSFMSTSMSRSYSEKSPTWPLRGSDERAFGAALPAPVDRGDGEAARAQFAHGLEIFLDEFGAALEQAHRALAAGRRMPARKAQCSRHRAS